MRRAILIALLAACTALAALVLPGIALAGTYTWKMPADFTSAAPGANPDQDSYGAKPWSYVEGPVSVSLLGGPDPSTGPFSRLPSFSTGIRGGLHGWTDTLNPTAFVALNPSSSPVGSVPAGQLALSSAPDRVVAIGWTSPLPRAAAVSVTGSVTGDDSCSGGGPVWSLSQNDSAIQSGSGSGSISASASVNPGATLYLGVSWSGAVYSASCETAGVSLQIVTSQDTAPAPTLDSPANGSLISGGQPTFSGSAGTGFGASKEISVRVYRGTHATGTPAQTLSATRGPSGGYSVGVDGSLADGQYTAVAEQDDLASPPDRGFSQQTTFTIHNARASIKLKSPGSAPLHTSTPTLSGTAGTANGDSANVVVIVYPGSSTSGAPLRSIQATRSATGAFSVRINPGLGDGQYTAVALQGSPAGSATSAPVTFRVKVHGPALTLTQPAAGSSVSTGSPIFGGAAGHNLGDSNEITVVLYAGAKAKGKPLGTMPITRTGATWSGPWLHPLKVGTYSAQAKQSDDAGHTTVTAPDTFQIVPGPTPIGSTVTLTRNGPATASVPVTCLAPAGQTCGGDVLVITSGHYRTMPSGPTGQLQVLFAYVTVPAGQTLVVTRPVSAEVARVLRRKAPLRVEVSTSLSAPAGARTNYAAVRTLRLGS